MKFATKKALAKKVAAKKTKSKKVAGTPKNTANARLDAMTAARENALPEPRLIVGLALEKETQLVHVVSTDPIIFDPLDLLSLTFDDVKVALDDARFGNLLERIKAVYGDPIAKMINDTIPVDARIKIRSVVTLLENFIANPDGGV